MAGYKTLIGPSVVISNLTKTQIATSAKPKQVIGNLQLVHRLLEKHIHQIIDPHFSLVSQVVNFANGGFKHQSAEVRSQSFHVILECYKTLGRDSIKVHLTGLRLA